MRQGVVFRGHGFVALVTEPMFCLRMTIFELEPLEISHYFCILVVGRDEFSYGRCLLRNNRNIKLLFLQISKALLWKVCG